FGLTGRAKRNPANGEKAAIITADTESLEKARQLGLTAWGPTEFLALTLAALLRKNAAAFHAMEITVWILDSLHESFPELVHAAEKRFPIESIHELFHALLKKQISIRDRVSILESMLSINGTSDVDLN